MQGFHKGKFNSCNTWCKILHFFHKGLVIRNKHFEKRLGYQAFNLISKINLCDNVYEIVYEQPWVLIRKRRKLGSRYKLQTSNSKDRNLLLYKIVVVLKLINKKWTLIDIKSSFVHHHWHNFSLFSQCSMSIMTPRRLTDDHGFVCF